MERLIHKIEDEFVELTTVERWSLLLSMACMGLSVGIVITYL